MRMRGIVMAALFVAALGFATVVCAQPAPGGGRPGGGGGGGFNPAPIIKAQLGVTDEEWTVLQPKVEAVTNLQRDMNPRMNFGRGGRGGRGNPQADGAAAGTTPTAPQSPLVKAMDDLRTTLENKDATAEQIKEKLTAVRDAREKAKQELAKARAALSELLTQRQEAQLVTMGVLE